MRRSVAVRSGPGNKLDGKLMPFPGTEEGSIDFEVCLSSVLSLMQPLHRHRLLLRSETLSILDLLAET